MTCPIPSPPSIPFLGHVTSIEREVPLRSFRLLSEQYGEIFQLTLISAYIVYYVIDSQLIVFADRTVIIASTVELVSELSDEKRFTKGVVGPLELVRNATGDGLFTVSSHRVLKAQRYLNWCEGVQK